MILIFLILIIIALYFLIKYILHKQEQCTPTPYSNTISQTTKISENPTNYSNYYTAKKYINTLNEMKFYQVLLSICKELDLVLFLYTIKIKSRNYN